MKQKTLKKSVVFNDIGLHTGKPVKLVVKPAPENHGLVFVKTNKDGYKLKVDLENIEGISRGTNLSDGTEAIYTFEHLMAAVGACGLTNLIFEIDSDEPPILDGSGDGYVESIDLKTNTVKINCFSKGGSLLVLSEIYYKPGWKCKINGKNTKIYQANHVLRSVYVPDGKHEVVFYYDNSIWKIARLTSRASFSLATFFCLFLFFNERRSILKLKKS